MQKNLPQTGPKYKRIVITSIPGSDWDEETNTSYVDALAARLEERGVTANIHHIRKILYQFAKEEHIPLDPTKVHNFSSDKKIRLLRRLAFGEIEKSLAVQNAQGNSVVTIIQTRATSLSSHGKEESLRMRYLQRIKPDLLVVIIDDPAAIYERIPKHDDTKKYAGLKIDDLVVWLEDEVADMQELAWDLDKCRLFVMPRRQVSALVDLIMTDKKPAYVSYAMTGASEQVKQQKDEVVKVSSNHFVVFDPECMGTAHTRTIMTDDEQSSYRDDVIMRDENWFIDINSEYVIVYLPEKGPAHGSQSELHTASEEFKTVLVTLEPSYSDERGRLTPFIDRRAEIVFISAKELEYYLALTADERQLYAHVVKSMWGFKRRGGLSPLVESAVDGRLRPLSEEEVQREFAQRCLDSYREQAVRGVLPVLDESTVLEMSQESWNFNKPLWAKAPTTGKILRLPMDMPAQPVELAVAARPLVEPSTTLRTPTRQANISLPTDNEAFSGVFERLAFAAHGPTWRDSLITFFRENGLGRPGGNMEFLRFLKRTVDAHKYKAAETLSNSNLTAWFREFNGGAEIGSKL
jgi:adenylate kinase